ncbi:DNA-3-methyladenine glycosylase family protein [Crenobacter intestini]|uniref:DNA-3-methyladenine glycosylase II n=1 Tax=Crenobacter intestini TaxID=2563443 RepID=A0A4V4N852_9NEIS|nr:DNA-3-methyladenine glycosylase [Crenobacter intestini]TIC83133.1 DNA-3-methyladenine glycosylase 2 family protein [Crenobacter intestini]
MSTPAWWGAACDALAAADPVMAALIRRYPDARLTSRGAPFETLLRAIVGQQISVAAADALWARLTALAPATPAGVLAMSPDALRGAGLSVRKAEYARCLAGHFADARIDPAHFAALPDEAVVDRLTAVRGIGRWSAEMFLIFNLNRPDVWPVDDIGLLRALAVHYLAGARPTPRQASAFGERFRPWRTLATWYLWRSLDPVEVQY